MAIELASGVTIAAAAATLPMPPVSWADVSHWRGVHPEFDIEIWADEAVTGSSIELVGAVAKPFAIADDDVDAVVFADDELTVTGHGYANGDGPVRLTTTDTLPAGLALATDYWIGVVDANTVQLYATLADVLAGGDAVAIGDAGTGTHTISDTDDTQRLRWLSHGLLGHDGDGAVALTVNKGYTARLGHRPRALAYALVGTVSAAVTAEIYLTRPVRV